MLIAVYWNQNLEDNVKHLLESQDFMWLDYALKSRIAVSLLVVMMK